MKLPLPPGPPLAGNWFVGSLSVFRTEYVWQTFAEWSKSLGMGLVMLCKVISITPTSGGYFDHEDCFFFRFDTGSTDILISYFILKFRFGICVCVTLFFRKRYLL